WGPKIEFSGETIPNSVCLPQSLARNSALRRDYQSMAALDRGLSRNSGALPVFDHLSVRPIRVPRVLRCPNILANHHQRAAHPSPDDELSSTLAQTSALSPCTVCFELRRRL